MYAPDTPDVPPAASAAPEGARNPCSWLTGLGGTLMCGLPQLTQWDVRLEDGYLQAHGVFADEPFLLTGFPRDDSASSWLSTASASWRLSLIAGTAPPAPEHQPLVHGLCELLRTDDGVLGSARPPAPENWKREMDIAPKRRDSEAGAQAHVRLRDARHRAAFIAYQTVTNVDLYPYTGALGVPVTMAEIEDGWRRTLARIRSGDAPDRLGIYVHIPFCAVECTFCFCAKTSRFNRGSIDDYMANMYASMERFGEIFDGQPVTSVYFGGGTPSVLPPKHLEQVFRTLYGAFNIAPGTSVIFEGNPDSLSPKKLRILGEVGRVTRLTVGVQTLDPEAQKRARRHNKHEHVRTAVEEGHKAGIPFINVDLMTGLDGQSMESFQDDLRFVISLRPESVHLNAFQPKKWTLYSTKGGEVRENQFALRDEMLRWGQAELRKIGFGRAHDQPLATTRDAANIQEYDVRKQNSSLLGFGVAARSHSFGSHFYENVVPDGDVAEGVEQSRSEGLRYCALPATDAEERHRYLVHNAGTGFSLAEFEELFGMAPWEAAPDGWQQLHDLGMIDIIGDRVITGVRTLVEDHIYRAFFCGPAVRDRVEAVWGHAYDRDIDYADKLQRLLHDDGRSKRDAT